MPAIKTIAPAVPVMTSQMCAYKRSLFSPFPSLMLNLTAVPTKSDPAASGLTDIYRQEPKIAYINGLKTKA
jgi:hypothetical protein